MAEINPQFIHAAGEELVVLTRAEFDALMVRAADADEDDADAAIFAEGMFDLQAGRDARLPPEVSMLMLQGHSLLRALRTWRGKTPFDLARGTNLTESYLVALESGAGHATYDALWSIADALDVPKEWIIPESLTQEPR